MASDWLLIIFSVFTKICVIQVQNLSTSRLLNSSSAATLKSMSAYKTIPLELSYLFYNEFGDPTSIGAYPVRDILLDIVNKNPTMLRAYNVSINFYDTKFDKLGNLGLTIDAFNKHVIQTSRGPSEQPQCETREQLQSILNQSTNFATQRQLLLSAIEAVNSNAQPEQSYQVPLMFGPEYSSEAKVIAQLAPLYNLMVICSGTGSPELSDREKYPTFFRTILSTEAFKSVPRALLTYFNYTTVAMANIDDSYGIEPMQKVDFDLHKYGYNVLFHVKFMLTNNATLDEFIDSIKLFDARIIIVYSNEPTNYLMYCRILKMFGGVDKFNSQKYLFIFLGIEVENTVITPEKLDVEGCTYDMLDSMLNGSFIAGFTSWGNDNDTVDWNMTTAEMRRKTYEVSNSTYGDPKVKLSNTLPQLIDAFWAGLLTLDRVDKRLRAEVPYARSLLDFNFQSSSDILAMMMETVQSLRFRGTLGEVAFTKSGDLAGSVLIRQFNTRRLGTFNRFMYSTETNNLTVLSTPMFGTVDGRPPPDKKPIVPVEDTTRQQLLIIILVVGGSLILLCLLGFWLYRRNLKQNLANPSWFVPFDALILKNAAQSRSSFGNVGSIGNQSTFLSDNAARGVRVAMLNDQPVRMQSVSAVGDGVGKLAINLQNHRVLTSFRDKLLHSNVVRFVGYTIAPVPIANAHTQTTNHQREQFLLWEHCEKGSLEQLVENEVQVLKLDAAFEYSILLDVAQGVGFLHKSFIKVHGALTTAACLIDKRFSIKVAHYGDRQLAPLFGLDTLMPISTSPTVLINGKGSNIALQQSVGGEKRLFWAPELLRDMSFLREDTQEADVYAFAIVMYSLATRLDPFDAFTNTYTSANGNGTTPSSAHNMTTEILLDMIREGGRTSKTNPTPLPIYRPSMEPLIQQNCDKRLQLLIQRCWSEQPMDRPNFQEIIRQLQTISGIKAGGSVTDQLLQRLERYASDMESLVAERTQELEHEKRRSDELLNAMLPQEIAKQLKAHGRVEPESFDMVTIYFSDIVGFTTLSSSSTPIEVVNLLNALYTMFDAQIDLFDAYKVETIGDAYMVVSGLPKLNGDMHVVHIARLSLALLNGINSFIIPHRPDEKLKLRIGLNSGPCVAGVVGIKCRVIVSLATLLTPPVAWSPTARR